MLTTEQAAALLNERGVTVKGRGQRPHAPSARTVEQWCRSGALKAERIGGPRRGAWLIDEAALAAFEPPAMGRKPLNEGDWQIISMESYGDGWQWIIRVGQWNPYKQQVEAWNRPYRTNMNGNGLWHEERQILGTSQFSLPRDRSNARRKIKRYHQSV